MAIVYDAMRTYFSIRQEYNPRDYITASLNSRNSISKKLSLFKLSIIEKSVWTAYY